MQQIRTNGVVKIFNAAAANNLIKPWTIDNNEWTGSGFIISDRIIVTNAHVAGQAKMMTIRKLVDGRRFPAKVIAMADQVDLAFITVDDEEFWSNALELEISPDLVRFQDEVHVVGYPTPGDTVCITEGVVSRIDWDSYCQSNDRNLCIQVLAYSCDDIFFILIKYTRHGCVLSQLNHIFDRLMRPLMVVIVVDLVYLRARFVG